MSTPVIVVTDLYQPPEDPGDNFDIVLPFAWDRIDLLAVVLDVSAEKRDSKRDGVPGYPGPREPGIIPLAQLNALFGTSIASGVSPFARMRHVDDQMRDVPPFQQAGPELILRTLRESERAVDIMSFGSARPIAVAFNRDPALFREKVARIHLSAGSETLDYLEWNVYLDPVAVRRLVESDLPMVLYPCATAVDCFSYGRHSTLWWLEDFAWLDQLDPPLRRYLLYGLGASTRIEFLRALEEDPSPEIVSEVYGRRHAVWETAAWIEASHSVIVRRADGTYAIVGREDALPTDAVIRNEVIPARRTAHESGLYLFDTDDSDGRTAVFARNDPYEYEAALRDALPRLYASFVAGGWQGSATGQLSDGPRQPYAGPLP